MDVGPAGSPEPSVVTTMPETTWIQPVSDTAVVSHDADPADLLDTTGRSSGWMFASSSDTHRQCIVRP